jgi:replicative DNA helicase
MKSLEAWARIKLAFLDPSYSSLYTAITKYYNKYNTIPSFEDLELTTRDTPLTRALASLKDLEVPDVDIDLAIDALIDSYTQTEALRMIDRFIDNITLCTTQEIKDNIANIAMKLDEKTHTSETVISMNSISLFKRDEDKNHARFPLGINNTFDSALGGAYRQELILVGGKRGSGKSIVCTNLCVNQLDIGNSAVYFTIEMTGNEIFERQLSIMSGVSHAKVRQNNLEFTDITKLVKARASMFEDADSLVNEFLEHKDKFKFESDLLRKFRNKFTRLDKDKKVRKYKDNLLLEDIKRFINDKIEECDETDLNNWEMIFWKEFLLSEDWFNSLAGRELEASNIETTV